MIHDCLFTFYTWNAHLLFILQQVNSSGLITITTLVVLRKHNQYWIKCYASAWAPCSLFWNSRYSMIIMNLFSSIDWIRNKISMSLPLSHRAQRRSVEGWKLHNCLIFAWMTMHQLKRAVIGIYSSKLPKNSFSDCAIANN